ncbi:sigma-70 family RNA polymerase sigma factor [Sphingopyxis sp. SE2]|uniref:RNA polymerase sigma factor n=1 Tax=Sphingopyxis sp. SE2 TaxID=1586240 RepID=UPI0028C1570B|nr:sigma-70 family RNA polymerase sigma factor [Sphingopyxis sp. SE2]MDT7530583.1 sigma-70 family RNA polymerase sigma factor [Sphingopyxis sp. SE2]
MTTPGPFASFDQFYRLENRRLFHFFRRRVGREEASDLTQEAFTRMLRTGAFERVENPRAYLFRAAHNLVIERARQNERKGKGLFPFDEGRDAPAGPEQMLAMEASDLRRGLRRVLLAMPRRTRRIFLMHRLRRQTYREIAEEIGIREQGVEYHMMRALARCRKAVAFQQW